MRKELFGKTSEGKEVYKYEIGNKNGMKVVITDYGATVVSIFVKDKDGNTRDVVLGYDTVEDYERGTCFFGAIVGRYANRISNAEVTIDGTVYKLEANNFENSLHSGKNCVANLVWDVKEQTDDSITFSIVSRDLEQGFPGNAAIDVTYTVTDMGELSIKYHGVSDKTTTFNMTNHSYFNLAGHNAGSILQHKLQILADAYTPVIPGSIPTGEIAPVKGTPFDFTTSVVIGEHIEDDNEQLKLGQGYDHNWVLDHCDGSVRKIAEVTEPVKGRTMTVYSDQPGMQFYAGNCISPHKGKANAEYGKRCGLALETQAYPDSVNRENFPDVIYGPDREYKTTTIYKLSW